MITITKTNISEWLLLDVYSEMNTVTEKLKFFERKYNKTFSEFEQSIADEKENFEKYDDYIEWKAYIQVRESIEKRITDIQNGNIEISK